MNRSLQPCVCVCVSTVLHQQYWLCNTRGGSSVDSLSPLRPDVYLVIQQYKLFSLLSYWYDSRYQPSHGETVRQCTHDKWGGLRQEGNLCQIKHAAHQECDFCNGSFGHWVKDDHPLCCFQTGWNCWPKAKGGPFQIQQEERTGRNKRRLRIGTLYLVTDVVHGDMQRVSDRRRC